MTLGNGASSILKALPKTVLVALVLFLSAATGWLSKAWVDHVNSQLEKLDTVALLARATAREVSYMKSEITEVKEIQVEQYFSSLDYYKWMAQLEGDKRRVSEIDAKIEKLKGRP